jgi:hypothetical protein
MLPPLSVSHLENVSSILIIGSSYLGRHAFTTGLPCFTLLCWSYCLEPWCLVLMSLQSKRNNDYTCIAEFVCQQSHSNNEMSTTSAIQYLEKLTSGMILGLHAFGLSIT